MSPRPSIWNTETGGRLEKLRLRGASAQEARSCTQHSHKSLASSQDFTGQGTARSSRSVYSVGEDLLEETYVPEPLPERPVKMDKSAIFFSQFDDVSLMEPKQRNAIMQRWKAHERHRDRKILQGKTARDEARQQFEERRQGFLRARRNHYRLDLAWPTFEDFMEERRETERKVREAILSLREAARAPEGPEMTEPRPILERPLRDDQESTFFWPGQVASEDPGPRAGVDTCKHDCVHVDRFTFDGTCLLGLQRRLAKHAGPDLQIHFMDFALVLEELGVSSQDTRLKLWVAIDSEDKVTAAGQEIIGRLTRLLNTHKVGVLGRAHAQWVQRRHVGRGVLKYVDPKTSMAAFVKALRMPETGLECFPILMDALLHLLERQARALSFRRSQQPPDEVSSGSSPDSSPGR